MNTEKRTFNLAEFGGHTIGSRMNDFRMQTDTKAPKLKGFIKVTLRESDDTIYCNFTKVEEIYPMVSNDGFHFTRLCYAENKYHDITETPEELGLDSCDTRMTEYISTETSEEEV